MLYNAKIKSLDFSKLLTCGRWDLNPHVVSDTRSLVLPVCQFQHFRIYHTCNAFHFTVPRHSQDISYHFCLNMSITIFKKVCVITVNDKQVLRICRKRDIKSTIKHANSRCTLYPEVLTPIEKYTINEQI